MCNCPSCQAQNAGMNGLKKSVWSARRQTPAIQSSLNGCGCNQQPTQMNGLDGFQVDFTATIAGALIGALVSHVAGWDWKLGAAIGAGTAGFVLPSMSS